MSIFLYFSADVIFSTLMKIRGKLKFKKNLKIKKFLAAPVSFFAQKLLIFFFLQMISLHNLRFHVHYEEVY